MDASNWRAQAQGGGEVGGVASGALNSNNWRTELFPDSRKIIVNKIMETFKRHLPISGQEGAEELSKIDLSFEEKIHFAATSQKDYLRKISLDMLNMETKCQSSASSGQNALNRGEQ